MANYSWLFLPAQNSGISKATVTSAAQPIEERKPARPGGSPSSCAFARRDDATCVRCGDLRRSASHLPSASVGVGRRIVRAGRWVALAAGGGALQRGLELATWSDSESVQERGAKGRLFRDSHGCVRETEMMGTQLLDLPRSLCGRGWVATPAQQRAGNGQGRASGSEREREESKLLALRECWPRLVGRRWMVGAKETSQPSAGQNCPDLREW